MPNCRDCASSRNVTAFKTVLVLFMQTMYALGTLKSIGVYVPKLIEGLGITPTDIGVSLGMFGAFAFIPGPFVTYLYQRLHGGYRWILVMIGALLAPGALIAGAFVNSTAQLAFSLSAAGLGSNILSIAVVITLRNQCGNNFGLFYGIGKSGYAFGMALVPLLADYLMTAYGWRGSLMIVGALMGHLIPLTMMIDINGEPVVQDEVSDDQRVQMDHEVDEEASSDDTMLLEESSSDQRVTESSNSYRNHDDPVSGESSGTEHQDEPLYAADEEIISDETRLLEDSSLRERDTEASGGSHDNNNATIWTKCKEWNDTARLTLKNSVFNRDPWLIHLMFVTFVYSMLNGAWNGFLIPRAVDRGFPTTTAVSFAYSAAVGAFVGRFFGGFILGLKRFSSTDWFLILTFVNIGSLLADIFVARLGVMLVTSFVSCMTLAERSTLVLVICTDRVTHSEFPLILASSEIMFGLGTFIGASLAGYIAYAYGSFNASYVFVAAADAIVFCLMIPPAIAEKMNGTT